MPDDDPAQERAKQLVDSVLANTHDSLKWSWQVVMGFALYTAVQETYIAITMTPAMPRTEFILCSLIAAFVFLPTFIRYFYGDNRYLDLHYSELRQWNNLEGYAKDLETKLSKSRRLVDVLLLLSHGIVFAFLALAIRKPEIFFCFYAVLLATNCFWLYTIVKMNETTVIDNNGSNVKGLLVGHTLSEIEERTTRSPKRDSAPRYWLVNNLCHFVLFALMYFVWGILKFSYREPFIILYIIASISNSTFDLYAQWEFYLPKLDEVYRQAKREAATVSPAPHEPSLVAGDG